MTEGPIRVAVVDDSALMRRMITAALSGASDILVVGAAGDAQEARALIRSADPDVVTLDVAMPGMSGLEFLRKIMELRPTPVIMVSNLTAEGAETSVSALQIGAIDVVQKPQGPDVMEAFAATLQAKVRLAASARATLASRRAAGPAPVRPTAPPQAAYARALIAIGASTGGVSALSKLLAGLPAGMPPIAVVQHMPKGYPERFAARLRAELGRDVAEARPGEVLGPGAIRFAPGDRHLRIGRRAGALRVELEDGPPVTGHCPSVDVLFESVARSLGARAIGVILTGMGRDGATGLAAMRRAGAACLAQDRGSSVVWGMPRAAVELDAVDEEVALDSLPARICHYATLAPQEAQPAP
jgi:two-component system, chemotaxis family, protein-glutamate methylesterase/glutaminase